MLATEIRRENSIQFRNIVFATDFLESSRLALDYAVAFAHRYSAKLTIVHAFQLSPEAEEAEVLKQRPSISREHAADRLHAFASGVRRLGVVTETDLRTGDPCTAVLSAAVDVGADLLVLGTHGVYKGFQHMLIGSNAEKMLLSSPCPTLTVGKRVMAGIDLTMTFKRLLLISDMSAESEAATVYAHSISRDLGIPIELLGLEPENGGSEEIRNIAETYCRDLSNRQQLAGSKWCDPDFMLEGTVPVDEIIRRATACGDGLVLLGVHKKSRWKRHMNASFAFQLVALSGCPVLSIHENDELVRLDSK